MASLPRSAVSFRRQGSSGLVWDDKFLSGELNQLANQQKEENEKKKTHGDEEVAVSATTTTAATTDNSSTPPAGLSIERSRSNGGRGHRMGRVPPAIEPPSPKVSACGFCGAFGNNNKTRRRPKKAAKRVM